MDFAFAHYLAKQSIDILQEIEKELKAADTKNVLGKTITDIRYPCISDLAELRDEIKDGYIETADQVPAEDIEEWKDIVIQSLPDGASVGMADDVEQALEHITSVY